MMKRYEKRAKCSLNNFQLFLGYAGSLPCLFLWCLLLVSPQFTKNKVFESELKLLRVESWKRVPCPERRVWNGMGEACGGTAGFPGLAAATPSLSLQVVRSVNDKRGWGSRMDAINEQSWLLPPPPFPHRRESANQVKHSQYICSHEGHCNTICWWRLAWLWSGGTWEMWILA